MELDLLEKVYLLAVLKKQPNETLKDILKQVEDTGTFTAKEGKKILKKLQNENYLDDNGLTFNGVTTAQIIENEFKL